MATKGTKNLFGGFKSPFGKSDPAAKKEEAKQQVTQIRDRERDMLALLGKIDLDDPQRQLSDAKIKELNIPGVIAYATKELKIPLITEYDTTNMDNNIRFIIKALKTAVVEGLEMTAEWACTALVFAIRNLRIEIDGIDEEYGAEMMQCRSEYSFNLELLVKSCIEHDRLSAELASENIRHQKERAKLDNDKADFQARRDSGELDVAMALLEQYTHNPAELSKYPEALAVRDELNNLHRLKASLIEIETKINTLKISLSGAENEIKSRRNALSSPPRVTDPKLHAKINEANRRFRDKLNDELNKAEKAIKDYDVHISAMQDLANHSVFITSVAKALEMDKELQMERYNQMLAEQQAEALRARAAANMELLRSSIPEQNVIHDVDEERIHEPETLTNYEFE